MHAVILACHPETPTDAVRGVSARVQRESGGVLAVSYVVEADAGRVRVPAPRPPQPSDRLWEHTCCELFIARKGEPAYREYNFSPSGEWAAYAFGSYRQRAAAQPAVTAPRIAARDERGILELDAVVDLDGLAPHGRARLALALSAVIEDDRGRLSYWALRHAPGKPDFHHAHAFALELGA